MLYVAVVTLCKCTMFLYREDGEESMDKKYAILFVLILILIAACARPPALKAVNKTKAKNLTNVSVSTILNETLNQTQNETVNTINTTVLSNESQFETILNQTEETTPATEEQNESIPLPDRVDIHTYSFVGGNKSDISATFGGKTKKYTINEGDKDALIY